MRRKPGRAGTVRLLLLPAGRWASPLPPSRPPKWWVPLRSTPGSALFLFVFRAWRRGPGGKAAPGRHRGSGPSAAAAGTSSPLPPPPRLVCERPRVLPRRVVRRGVVPQGGEGVTRVGTACGCRGRASNPECGAKKSNRRSLYRFSEGSRSGFWCGKQILRETTYLGPFFFFFFLHKKNIQAWI